MARRTRGLLLLLLVALIEHHVELPCGWKACDSVAPLSFTARSSLNAKVSSRRTYGSAAKSDVLHTSLRPRTRIPRNSAVADRSDNQDQLEMRFSHVHMYVDSLQPLDEYKKLERRLNEFVGSDADALLGSHDSAEIQAARAAWLSLGDSHGETVDAERSPEDWTPAGQDIVEQLLVGLGWRVTGMHQDGRTGSRTLAVSSSDSQGVKFVISARSVDDVAPQSTEGPMCDHFDVSHLERFEQHRAGREGFAVLGFDVGPGVVQRILARYEEQHPGLLLPGTPRSYEGDDAAQVLEVFAYYSGDGAEGKPDQGTVIRFVEQAGASSHTSPLPGIRRVEAQFDAAATPAYCDHWVSNVVSRTGFLDTLHDTLGFTPKVDFNAGVVAAGEAQIESTVTGNSPGFLTKDKAVALRDQRQIYLPINNALSEVGHVHQYLDEIGQGVQHIASRVADLPKLVQRANNFRKITGAGLSFLSLPGSYYGMMNAEILSKDADIEIELARLYVSALKLAGITDSSDIVALDADAESVRAALPADVPAHIVDIVLRGRYRNLYTLIGSSIDEETYLSIVRNNILVDIQGDDLLMQIFTTNVLQRVAGEEAPFLEFIQRVCFLEATSEPRDIKPGCGGFGIRNFLTLFLSIEVSKATKDRAVAESLGQVDKAAYFDRMVHLFTAQLDESSPILNLISDAMAAEGEASERGDIAEQRRCVSLKSEGNESLQRVSTKYKALMKELREELARKSLQEA